MEGVIRYARELLTALVERESEQRDQRFEYLLFGVDGLPGWLTGHDCVRSADVPATAHSGLRAHAWEQLSLPRAVRGHDLDVFHTPAGEPPVLATVPHVTTVHDVSPVAHPEWFSRRYVALHQTLLPLAVYRSSRLIAVSECSREALVDAYPRAAEKTVAVHNGVRPPDPNGTSVDGLDPGGFLLSVGAANPRKNLDRLVRAYATHRAREDDPLPLVLAGPERAHFADADVGRTVGVRTLGFVPATELSWLYREASAFAFPSLYEGFGLPILEAMGAGTPVVTSDRGAMAEVAGDAACLVDPYDVGALADGIERVVNDEELRKRLVRRGRSRAAEFTWDRAAEETEAVYREAACV